MANEGELLLGITGKNETQRKETSSRYPALRFIASIYRLLAYLIGIAAFICVFIGLIIALMDDGERGILMIIVGLLGGFVGFITSLAAAEGIIVFLDIEKNTRNKTSQIKVNSQNIKPF